ncbi:acetylcholinesterase-like [Ornithodoros turicata]|uniref:acetylcholinesterase-like n=1 Tax=Ornithodoros turicata TaxID=34597 RepID=UPI0031398026
MDNKNLRRRSSLKGIVVQDELKEEPQGDDSKTIDPKPKRRASRVIFSDDDIKSSSSASEMPGMGSRRGSISKAVGFNKQVEKLTFAVGSSEDSSPQVVSMEESKDKVEAKASLASLQGRRPSLTIVRAEQVPITDQSDVGGGGPTKSESTEAIPSTSEESMIPVPGPSTRLTDGEKEIAAENNNEGVRGILKPFDDHEVKLAPPQEGDKDGQAKFVRRLSAVPSIKWCAKAPPVAAPQPSPDQGPSPENLSISSVPPYAYDAQTRSVGGSVSALLLAPGKRQSSRRGSIIYRQRSMRKCLLAAVVGIVALAVLMTVAVFSLMRPAHLREVFVHTPKTKYRGFIKDILGVPLLVFTGVPFAVDPAGSYRFRAPGGDPKLSYVEATSLKSECPQGPFLYDGQVRQSAPAGTEKCLHLNIWVPRGLADKKAVMIFYYGYSFLNGANNYKEMDASYLSVIGDIIVVVPNYRVGVLGFLSDSSDDHGNAGLYDQLAATQWVRDHIHYFGGDPNLITIVGHDAGAASIGLNILLFGINPPKLKWLPRYILHSGSPLAPLRDNTLHANANLMQVAQGANCSADSSFSMECLKSVSVSELIPKDAVNSSAEAFNPTFLSPLLPYFPADLLARSKVQGVQVLIGTVWNEGIQPVETQKAIAKMKGHTLEDFFANDFPRAMRALGFSTLEPAIKGLTNDSKWATSSKAPTIAERIYGDLMFHCPVRYFAEFLGKHTKPRNQVYMFVVNERPSWSVWTGHNETTHYEDLDFLFAAPYTKNSATREDKVLSADIITSWVHFAKTGSPPYVDDEPWPMFSTTNDVAVEVSAGALRLVRDHRRHRCNELRDYILSATKPSSLSSSRNS